MPRKWSMLLVTPGLTQDLLSPLKRPLGFGLTHFYQDPVGEVDGWKVGAPGSNVCAWGVVCGPVPWASVPASTRIQTGRSYRVRQSMWKILISLA